MRPETEAELAELIRGAEAPLRVIGGGTRDIGRPVAGDTLSVAGLSGISLYEPGALTLVASAGTPVAEIDRVLAAEGQRLAFEPMDHRALLATTGEPTIGGVVAGVLFELGKWCFNLFVVAIYQGSITTRIYGAFALLPIFLIWIFIAWLIFLIGVSVTHNIQHTEDRER